METGVTNLMADIHKAFAFKDVDIRTYSPLVLAYIGDGIYELVIRSLLVGQGNAQAAKLHKRASALVNAGAQAAMAEKVKEQLTEEELHVFRRGRNANSPTMAKHATMSEYRRATGFEALMGYLYLEGRTERLLELVKLGLEEEPCDTKN
ncbi:MAG: ribonuclease III [Lachnospiraceae bacterium]|jgi:ribonuclease-3 family protein|uniref:Mini-ribonuclease 3 n=1 Tax=Candidatus Merdisoma sp. JLR.KK006 TaxID=3112626 RepID=UPI002FF2BAF2|nr:ribonuclease III [Lachnospiraceae bacterium]